jgi:signal transduction histidine kinase
MGEHTYTILIIDDEASVRDTLAALLQNPDYRVEMAEDGIAGFERAKQIKPDVILLDVMMPRMNGYDVCKRIRQDEEIKEVPIIMVTALDDRDAKLNGLTAGADDFLFKPFDSLELKIRLHTLRYVDRYRNLVEDREKLNKALAQLSEKNKQLKALSRQVLEAQENERRRVAVELHDEIGQLLTGLKFILQRGRHDSANIIEEALKVTNELMRHTREMSLNLRPATLDDLGLFAALDDLFKRFAYQTKIIVHSNLNPLADFRLGKDIETAAFRVVQEALTNIARHAGVSEANVTLTVSPTRLRVSIADSGKGFDVDSKDLTASTGISGMAERVNLAGGRFSLQSKPGAGSFVLADFELNTME